MNSTPLSGRIFQWLQKAISTWQSEGIINAAQAEQLRGRYVCSGKDVWLAWVLGLLAALLIGGGFILLLAHNWYELGHLTRALIALSPLLILQGICLWFLKRRRISSLLGECMALLFGAAQGAAIALVSQTYHLYGELWQFLLLWLMMMLPAAMILRAQALFILAMILSFATLDAAPSVYHDGISRLPSVVLWLVGGCVLLGGLFSIYMHLTLCRWAALLAVLGYIIVITDTQRMWQYSWLLFAIFYALGLMLREQGWHNALRWVGAAGLCIFLLTIGLFSHALEDLVEIEPIILLFTVTLVIGAIIQTWRTIPRRLHQPYRWCLLLVPFCSWLLMYLQSGDAVANGSNVHLENIESISSTAVFVIVQLGLLLTALLLVAGGLAQARLLVANAGLLLLLAQLGARFFDSDWSLLGRGIGFIICGLLLMVLNIFLLKRRRKRHIIAEPLFPVQTARSLPNSRALHWAFAVLCIAQLAYIVNTVVQAEWTLSTGTLYRLQTQPVDPYDPFRGRYVHLNFALENTVFPLAGRTCDDWHLLPAVYAVLDRDKDGVAKVTHLSASIPDGRDAIRVAQSRCNDKGVKVRIPFHHFYANELLAPQLEKQAREHAGGSYLAVRVRGHYAVPEALQIGTNTPE